MCEISKLRLDKLLKGLLLLIAISFLFRHFPGIFKHETHNHKVSNIAFKEFNFIISKVLHALLNRNRIKFFKEN